MIRGPVASPTPREGGVSSKPAGFGARSTPAGSGDRDGGFVLRRPWIQRHHVAHGLGDSLVPATGCVLVAHGRRDCGVPEAGLECGQRGPRDGRCSGREVPQIVPPKWR